ncbi:MAG: Trm112 family protein [Nitrospirae bacterium]|nr:Trm112 family protein [Nitrospirota bacterium]
MIKEELLEILACPKCKGDLQLKDDEGLLCNRCRLIYPIRDGIPVMIVEEAREF